MILTIIIGILGLSILASLTPYRLNRLAPVWNPIAQKYFPSLVIKKYLEDNFHISQSLLAIGSGGITGVGFGKSASKYSLLPEPMGDSIFAVIAEEFGFIGSVIVILTFLIIFWRGIGIALHIYDDFARFTVAGFMSIISIQTIIHIGANSGLFPFTGVPLPLVSYGGTAMAVVMTMIGIIVNISRYTTHKI
jgi:cell division protein FtsW